MNKFWLAIGFVGLLLASCERDPCAKKECGKHAYCVEGECVCEEGWEGPLCQYAIPPYRAVLVDSVQLLEYPLTNRNDKCWDCSFWDDAWGADPDPEVYILIAVLRPDNRLDTVAITRNIEEEKDSVLSMRLRKPIEKAGYEAWIYMLDYDQGDPDDKMATKKIHFYPDLTLGMPDTVRVELSPSAAIRLFLSYQQ